MKILIWMLILMVLQDGSCGGDESNNPTSNAANGKEKRAAGDPFARRSAVDKNFIRFGRSSNYFHEQPNRSQKNVMSLARVSRATKDNFIRFGRPDIDLEEIDILPTDDEIGDNFIRFGRGKDNFMRFGRGKDNFMRFGRGKDNFMRFGRGKDNFMRFGRGKDNFMRFGRGKDNFMRFGRNKENFMRFGRNPNSESLKNLFGKDYESDLNLLYDKKNEEKGSFVRYGKSPKKEDAFIRFGRLDSEAELEEPKIDDDGSDSDVGDLDLQGDKPKHGPIIRNKRNVDTKTTLWEVEENPMNRESRAPEQEEDTPPQTKGGNNNKRSIPPYFIYSGYRKGDQPGDEDFLDSNDYYYVPEMVNEKRNSGGSSFIRFG